jgi:hypothetical protein
VNGKGALAGSSGEKNCMNAQYSLESAKAPSHRPAGGFARRAAGAPAGMRGSSDRPGPRYCEEFGDRHNYWYRPENATRRDNFLLTIQYLVGKSHVAC